MEHWFLERLPGSGLEMEDMDGVVESDTIGEQGPGIVKNERQVSVGENDLNSHSEETHTSTRRKNPGFPMQYGEDPEGNQRLELQPELEISVCIKSCLDVVSMPPDMVNGEI